MKVKNIAIGSVMTAALLVGAQAHATSAIDYSYSTTLVSIGSSSQTSPTVLRSVTVKCPNSGYLHATADAQFVLRKSGSGAGTAHIVMSLSRTSKYDGSHYNIHQEYFTSPNTYSPASIQRVDSCSKNQFVTYYFVAYRGTGAVSGTYAWQPELVVTYHQYRI